LSGGGAKSPFWHQLFADIFAQDVATLETQEGSAYGAALLALVGTGEFSSAVEACRAAVKEVEVKKPDPQAAEFYNNRYRVYCSLYPALRQIFHNIGELDE
jgi:xylulokinase